VVRGGKPQHLRYIFMHELQWLHFYFQLIAGTNRCLKNLYDGEVCASKEMVFQHRPYSINRVTFLHLC
jgi:hypothetical protein